MMTKKLIAGLVLALLLFSGVVLTKAEVIPVEFVGTPSESEGTITIVVKGLDFNELMFYPLPSGNIPAINIAGVKDTMANTTTFVFKRPNEKLVRCNFHTGSTIWGGVTSGGILGVMNVKNKKTGDTETSFYLKKLPTDPDVIDKEMYW